MSECAACGTSFDSLVIGQRPPERRYCEAACMRVTDGDGQAFVNVTTAGAEPLPHLHLTCPSCGFEWLSPVKCRSDVDALRAIGPSEP